MKHSDIFNVNKIFEHTEDEEDHTCQHCAGTGEGRWDGSACTSCGGTGVEKKKLDYDDYLDEETLNELSPDTLKRYARANVDDQVQRASSDSFRSGAMGDKYNRADVTHKDRMRQRGMDRALDRLSGKHGKK